jgi:hypothetical protein
MDLDGRGHEKANGQCYHPFAAEPRDAADVGIKSL